MINLHALTNQKRPKVGSTLFVSIDGHGGSGKTTLAKKLSALLDCEVIHTDDFASMDNPKNWWPQLVQSVFEPIASGATELNYARSKWWENHEPEPIINQRVTELMILEGVGSSQLSLCKYLGLSIFVDTARDVCLQRGIARDLMANAGTEDEIVKHWEQWIQEELDYFKLENPKQFADAIVDGMAPFSEQIMGLK